MSREKRAAQATETDGIVASGGYTAPSGAWVAIDAAVDASLSATRLISAEAATDLARRGGDAQPPVTLTNRSTLAAMAEAAAQGLATTTLVFASARNPGGGYKSGAQAQEESLARASALVKTQLSQEQFYAAHRANKSLLYSDAMILSPGAPVFRDDSGALLEAPYLASFITCAAPNFGAMRSDAERALVEPTLARRMRAVIALAVEAGADKLILGAWGCGVFRNDPALVARLWRDALSQTPGAGFSAGVEMAVYDPSKGETWHAFASAFGG